jgi:small-conductance mechanosensitive channel
LRLRVFKWAWELPQIGRIIAGAALIVGILVCAAPERAQNSQDQTNAILSHLNAAIHWYKDLTGKAPAELEPSDSIYLSNAEALGAQVVRLAFQSAKVQANLNNESNGNGGGGQNGNSSNGASQHYAQVETQVQQRIADDEAKLNSLKASSRKISREKLQAQQQSLEGKLELDKATLDAVRQMRNFAENTSAGASGLEQSINELARSVPDVLQPTLSPTENASKGNSGEGRKATDTAAAAAKKTAPVRSGLLGQLMTLYDEMQSIRSTQQMLDETSDVEKAASNVRGPLRTQLKNTFQQGNQLAAQADASKQQYEEITRRFKNISAALLPLSEEILVLDQSRANLQQWRSARTAESRTTLVAILMRVLLIVISIGIVLGLAEAWKKLTFRYIRDAKRRRQFMVVRRFVIGFLVFLVVILGFASEFSSLATFAGFVTAGIAVGLQTILLSVAAYFFVIGRYGISVGDRISVAGVTGDVVDVGLVRFYVMEFAASGPELYPTGRIAVFSNAVLFQATTPLFKQLPGTRYTWHEAVLPLAPKADLESAQRALQAAISPVFKEYSLEKAYQHRDFDSIDLVIHPPAPEQRIQFAESGPELVARYPVDLTTARELDEKITLAIINAVRADSTLAAAVTASPKIRPAVKS